jgi:hypothetical protein
LVTFGFGVAELGSFVCIRGSDTIWETANEHSFSRWAPSAPIYPLIGEVYSFLAGDTLASGDFSRVFTGGIALEAD